MRPQNALEYWTQEEQDAARNGVFPEDYPTRGEIKGKILQCIDRDDELRLDEIAAKGLDTRVRWYRCKAGVHLAHSHCGKTATLKACSKP